MILTHPTTQPSRLRPDEQPLAIERAILECGWTQRDAADVRAIFADCATRRLSTRLVREIHGYAQALDVPVGNAAARVRRQCDGL